MIDQNARYRLFAEKMLRYFRQYDFGMPPQPGQSGQNLVEQWLLLLNDQYLDLMCLKNLISSVEANRETSCAFYELYLQVSQWAHTRGLTFESNKL